MPSQNSLQRAVANLASLAGRARRRILDDSDLIQALDEARRDGWGIRAGETVANSYGYAAYRMRLAVVRMATGDYAYRCDWGNARRGSSDCPLGGQRGGRNGWEARLARLAARRAPATGWRVIRARDVRRLLAERRATARRSALSSWPSVGHDIAVTIDDSIAAGNCERESARVATWFAGSDAVMASDLRREVLRREPELACYARRAVDVAVRRTLSAAAY